MIAGRHGRGRWWDCGGPVRYCTRDGDDAMVRSCTIDGVVHAVMAAYYHHDPEQGL